MDEDLNRLGEDLITTAARMVRWAPTEGASLSLASARILARLSDNGPMRISTLAAVEKCSQPTITNHVKRLESASLVSRDTDPTDGRACVIALTAVGQEQLGGMRRLFGRNLEPYLQGMSRRDRKALREGIEAMRRLMSQPAPRRTTRLPQ